MKLLFYKDGELELPVEVTPDKETVWLNRNQLATLFDRDIKTIGKHINNALKEELDTSVVAKFALLYCKKIILLLMDCDKYLSIFLE